MLPVDRKTERADFSMPVLSSPTRDATEKPPRRVMLLRNLHSGNANLNGGFAQIQQRKNGLTIFQEVIFSPPLSGPSRL